MKMKVRPEILYYTNRMVLQNFKKYKFAYKE